MPRIDSKNLLLLLICFSFLINPMADFLSTISSFRVSLFVRGGVSILVIVSAFLIAARSKSQLLFSSILLLPVLSIFIWYASGYYNSIVFFENSIFLLKVLSFFAYLRAIKQLSMKQISVVVSIVKGTLIIYMALIVVGAIFEIQIFKSYADSVRFGYKGIVIAQNEASGLIMASLLIAGFNFVVRQANTYDAILFLVSSVAALFLGTKAAVLLPVIIVCIIFWARYGSLKAIPYVTTALLASIMVAIALYEGWSNEIFLASKDYFSYQFEYYARGDLTTLLLSGRNYKLAHVFNNYVLSNPWYLVLGGFPMGSYSVEIDFFDLLFFMGAPVFIVYTIMLYKAFRVGCSKVVMTYSISALILVVLVSNTSGHILNSALVLPYLAVFSAMCYSFKKTARPDRGGKFV